MNNKSYNMLIAGVVGSGKSWTENRIIENVLQIPGARLVLIDPKRVELAPWKNNTACLWYASDEGEILDTLQRVYDLMDLRFQRMQAKGLKVTDEPHVFCFVDEMAFLMQSKAKKAYTEMFSRICLMGRAARIHLILCSQVCTQAVIPACIRDNMVNIVCLRQRDEGKYRYLLGKMPAAGPLPAIGSAYVLTPSLARPQKVKTEDVWAVITGEDETSQIMEGKLEA